jgi:6,7-dimethyl-8-ribityllumazine synthase
LVTERLAEGARAALQECGVQPDDIESVAVPGAFELPQGVRLAMARDFDAIVAIGCVVRGETPHFDYVCDVAARGLGLLSAEGKIPIGFGVLTADTMEQAMARAGGSHGNKGADAALAALEMCDLRDRLG